MVEDRAAIAILGPEGDPTDKGALSTAQTIASGLGRAGYVLVVAGRGGIARAVAQGAVEQSATVLAVHVEGQAPDLPGRVDAVSVPGPLRRIESVLAVADAVMVFPGDLTSLATVLQIWSYGLTPDAPYRQMVLVGDGWPETVKALADAARLDQRTRAMVTFAPNATEALESIRYYIAPVP